MARKSETAVIDGLKCTVTQFKASEAYPLSLRVGKLMASVLGRIDLKVFATGSIDGATLLHLVDALSSDETLVAELLKCVDVVHEDELVTLDSTKARDQVFTGKLATMIRVAVFSARVNFANFFGDVFGVTSDVEKMVAETKTEATESA